MVIVSLGVLQQGSEHTLNFIAVSVSEASVLHGHPELVLELLVAVHFVALFDHFLHLLGVQDAQWVAFFVVLKDLVQEFEVKGVLACDHLLLEIFHNMIHDCHPLSEL